MIGPRDQKDTSYTDKDTESGTHHTWYDGDRNSRISWDSDRDGDYVPGSGHEVDQGSGRVVSRWGD